MPFNYPTSWPEFYTATILNWKPILSDNNFKDIIINSLQFLVNNKRIELNAFVIMDNHIHVIWQALHNYSTLEIRSAFMKFTAHQIKKKLEIDFPQVLQEFKVHKHDRHYQIWKREALSVELFTPKVYFQKLDYIHENPVRAGLCKNPEE
jgi:REP element-mobilizing transposase RayT